MDINLSDWKGGREVLEIHGAGPPRVDRKLWPDGRGFPGLIDMDTVRMLVEAANLEVDKAIEDECMARYGTKTKDMEGLSVVPYLDGNLLVGPDGAPVLQIGPLRHSTKLRESCVTMTTMCMDVWTFRKK